MDHGDKKNEVSLHWVTIDPDSICPDDDRPVNAYASWAITPKTSSAEDAKEWDRQAVRAIPEVLAAGGFEVYRLS